MGALTVQNGKPKAGGGGKPGNRNALRHGLYSPNMGDGLQYPDKQAGRFRRALEDQHLAEHGAIDVTAAALIHTATEAQRLAFANRARLVAMEEGTVKPELRLQFDAHYLRCLETRDRKLQALAAMSVDDPMAGLPLIDIPAVDADESASQDCAGGAQTAGHESEHHNGEVAPEAAVGDSEAQEGSDDVSTAN